MVGRVDVKIHGLQQIQAALRELPKRVDSKILNDGLLAGARIVRDDARLRAPLLKVPDARRLRGLLRRAIHAGRVRPQRYAATVWVRLRSLSKSQVARFKKRQLQHSRRVKAAVNPLDPFYWRFIEFGTSKMRAQPFMRPAFESKKEPAVRAAVARFKALVQAEIEKLGQRMTR